MPYSKFIPSYMVKDAVHTEGWRGSGHIPSDTASQYQSFAGRLRLIWAFKCYSRKMRSMACHVMAIWSGFPTSSRISWALWTPFKGECYLYLEGLAVLMLCSTTMTFFPLWCKLGLVVSYIIPISPHPLQTPSPYASTTPKASKQRRTKCQMHSSPIFLF